MNSPLLGIEIGGTKLQIVCGTGDGSILERRRFHVDPAAGADGIRGQITSALPGLIAAAKPRSIGVGFGGPVDRGTGKIACSHQIAGWSDFPLVEWLQSASGLPVVAENDANTAALGEAICGAGKGFDPVFYVTLGSGVGGGLVVNGAVYHGMAPGEAEIGHLRMDASGVILEQRCSGWAVDQRIREAIAAAPAGFLARLTTGIQGGEARKLGAALEAKDPQALRILDDTAAYLAFGLSHVTHLMHPAVIVLGGGLSLLGEPLRAAVAQKLTPNIMSVFRPGPELRLAQLREDAVPVGALLLAGRREFQGS